MDETDAAAAAMDAAFESAGITDADFQDTPEPKAEPDAAEPKEEAAPVETDDPEPRDDETGEKSEGDENPEKAEAESDEKQDAEKEDKPAIGDAPSRFSPDAKEAWKNAPASVRGEINRAISELEGGLRRYQEAFEPLKAFDKMARDGGTTLPQALQKYVGMEDALRANPIKGFEVIAQNMGMDLKAIAAEIMGVDDQGQPSDAAKDREITGLKDEVTKLTGMVQSLQQGAERQQVTSIEREVQAFRAAHPRFDELEAAIAAEITAGHSLEDAYTRAELLNPLPQKPPEPQKPAANLATTGAPAGGSNPPRSKTPPKGRAESLDRIFDEVGIT